MQANRLPIVDREALKRVLIWLEQNAGSGNKAAKRLGIGQGTFSRLLCGTTHSMDVGTFFRISEGLGGRVTPEGYPQEPWPFTFERPPLSDVALARAESLKRQGAPGGIVPKGEPEWWSQESEVRRREALWLDLQQSVLGPGALLTLRNHAAWMRRESGRLRASWQQIGADADAGIQDVIRLPHYRAIFEKFARRVGRSEPYPEESDFRYWIAVYRAFEPFVAAADSWGVELRWEELRDAGTLSAYLEAALARETVLMTRYPDVKRATLVEPTMTEGEWLSVTEGAWVIDEVGADAGG